ncbi:hypothetical protein, partial [Dialister succinatiphilus]|uniref:hypothetical protein n=1 Tax=Dialister succinatiphilus TaxID=487173 RepID=UPI00402617A7
RLAEKQDKSLSNPRNFLPLYYIHCKKCDFVNMESEVFQKICFSLSAYSLPDVSLEHWCGCAYE